MRDRWPASRLAGELTRSRRSAGGVCVSGAQDQGADKWPIDGSWSVRRIQGGESIYLWTYCAGEHHFKAGESVGDT